MAYLIDGHNLIPHVPDLHLEDIDDEQALIELLQGFCRHSRKSVEVYFDNAPAGQAGKRRFGMVTAVFVRQGRTADDAIRQRLEQLKGRASEFIVVSSDHQVQNAARVARADVIPSPAFARQMKTIQQDAANRTAEKQPPDLTDAEIDEWLQIFNNRRNHPNGQ